MKKFTTLFFTLLIITPSIILSTDAYKKFVILIPSYNNEQYAEGTILSALQDYPEDRYRIIFVDDCSHDKTLITTENAVARSGKSHLVTIIHNYERKGALRNLYETINNYTEDEEIIAILDGDDQLANKDVLTLLNDIYSNHDVWLTYGQFKHSSNNNPGFCQPMPESTVENNAFRQWPHGASHLKTFYSKLFKNIKREDLMIKNSFFEMCYDLAIMFPMLEQANDRFKFIPEVLYIYNDINPISDHRKSKALQRNLDLYIRTLPCYSRLDRLF